MLETQLIVVEGVMGSGKSTLSAFIAQHLQQQGYPARHVPERFRDHPTYVTPTLRHWQKSWLDGSPDALIAQSLRNWQALVMGAQQSHVIYVYDGQFFHGDMTSLLIANTPRAQLVAYLDSLVALVAPLQPAFIYLYQQDVGRALAQTAKARGNSWLRRQVQWKVDSPYCQARNYVGVAGWLQLYRDFRQLTDELYERLPAPKLAIENSGQQWAHYEQQVLAFLDLAATSLVC